MSFDPSHDLASGDERLALERRARTEKVYSPIVILLTALAAAGILLYSWFLLDPGNRGDLLPWSMVIVAETVLIRQALVSMWTILAGAASPRDYAFHAARDALLGPVPLGGDATDRPIRVNGKEVLVDVFITVYGEPVATIRRTATAAQRMTGRHRTWILDDGRSDEVKELAAELGVHYVRRLSNNGAKAGNVNHALSIAKGDYFAIFDADFVPKENFLLETVPFFVSKDVAFVQTPQTYGNLTSVISRGAGYMQTVFYRFIQPGRNHFNAAFCVGTNVVFRRAAVDDIGGMYTDSKSEDVWTSLMLHERGWRSVYIPDVLAVGDAPETIEGFTKQQQRWATGGFEILMTHNPLSRKRRLTADQRIMYLVTATHYLTGITPALLLLVPPLEIYFDLRPVSAGLGLSTWLLFYLGFYGMQVVLAFFTLGSFRWESLMLATVSFPIYTRALFNVLVGREQKWHVTGSPWPAQLAVQLHGAAGAHVHLPAAQLRRRHLARHRPQPADPGHRLEHHQHGDPRRLRRRRDARAPAPAAPPPRRGPVEPAGHGPRPRHGQRPHRGRPAGRAGPRAGLPPHRAVLSAPAPEPAMAAAHGSHTSHTSTSGARS